MEDREFLAHLCDGVREVPKRQRSIFLTLQALDAIEKREQYYCLKDSFILGSIDIPRERLAFLRSFSSSHSRDFRVVGSMHGSMSGDLVIAARIGKTLKAKILRVLSSTQKPLIVYLDKKSDKTRAFSLHSQKPITLKSRQKALNALPQHAVLKVDSRDGSILEVLGVLEDESIDEKLILTQYDRGESFPQDCLTLAQSFNQSIDLYRADRLDLTHLPFCTIDPKDARDHDDAIYFDASLKILYVAIADVSEYISYEGAINQEAKKRGFSVYLPHKSIPMLPREISENLCSLNAGEERLALVWELHLSDQGELIQSHIHQAIICVEMSLEYERVDILLSNQSSDGIRDEIVVSLKSFYLLSERLRENRLKMGYDFCTEETKLYLDEDMRLIKVESKTQGKSHQLIEEAMLLANVESAKMIAHLPVHGIYRVHESIKEAHYFDLLANLKNLGFKQKTRHTNIHQSIQQIQEWSREVGLQNEVDRMIIQAQAQAQYSSLNTGHFGLGFECYTHFTSPIRRYSDLCIHRLIKEAIRGGKRLRYLSEDFPSLTKRLSELEREVKKIEMQYRDRKFVHWACRHQGEVLQARVIDERYSCMLQAIDKIQGARVILQDRARYELFECMEIEIIGADLANARIYAKRASKG